MSLFSMDINEVFRILNNTKQKYKKIFISAKMFSLKIQTCLLFIGKLAECKQILHVYNKVSHHICHVDYESFTTTCPYYRYNTGPKHRLEAQVKCSSYIINSEK